MLRFTRDHEWVRLEGDVATVGISQYAQDTLGEVVFVELPPKGAELTAGGDAVVMESVKAASEIYAPLSGKVIAVNAVLETKPGLVNSDPMGQGWLFKLTLAQPEAFEALMDEDAYKRYIGGLD